MQAWRRVWFPLAPLSDLAIARVLLALIVLWLNGRSRFASVANAPAFTWDPVALVRLLGLDQPSAEQMHALHVATRALLVAGGLGIFTNLALLGAFLLQLLQEALLNCFGKVAHSTIPLLHAMLFLALSPCGRVWSVDALVRRRWRGAEPRHDVAARSSRFARWPFELPFVELAFYYFDAGLSKVVTSGFAWADGATLQYYLLHRGLPAGEWVASSLTLCRVLSWGALLFELGFPLAIVVRRLRLPFLGLGVLFHLGNHVLMNLSFWPVPATYLLAVPWSELRRTLGGRRRSPAADAEPSGETSSAPPRRALAAGGKLAT